MVSFQPDVDLFQQSPNDLNFLNEPYAGSKGFIKPQGKIDRLFSLFYDS